MQISRLRSLPTDKVSFSAPFRDPTRGSGDGAADPRHGRTQRDGARDQQVVAPKVPQVQTLTPSLPAQTTPAVSLTQPTLTPGRSHHHP